MNKLQRTDLLRYLNEKLNHQQFDETSNYLNHEWKSCSLFFIQWLEQWIKILSSKKMENMFELSFYKRIITNSLIHLNWYFQYWIFRLMILFSWKYNTKYVNCILTFWCYDHTYFWTIGVYDSNWEINTTMMYCYNPYS